jgi:hypothetical protein
MLHTCIGLLSAVGEASHAPLVHVGVIRLNNI